MPSFLERQARRIASHTAIALGGSLAAAVEKINAEPAKVGSAFDGLRRPGHLAHSALHPAAATKLRKLTDQLDELRAIQRSYFDEQQNLFLEKQEAATRVRTLTEPLAASMQGDANTYGENHPSVIQARQQLADVETKLRDLARKQSDVESRARPLAALVGRLQSFDAARLEPFDQLVSTKGETIQSIRDANARAKAEREKVRAAPPHSEEAKAKAANEVNARAERGKPDLSQLLLHGGSIGWPSRNQDVHVSGFSVGEHGTPIVAKGRDVGPDALAVLAWMSRDDLIDRLHAEIDAVADDANALTSEERKARLADLDAELLRLERIEEQIIEDANGSISRRGDADPRAVLSLT